MRVTSVLSNDWNSASGPAHANESLANCLLRVVDAGLCGVVFIAPFFFGGRHDLGRLVLVSLIVVTAVSWFARQALLCAPRGPKTAANIVLLLATGLVVLQIVPLPHAYVSVISPRTGELLPLWAPASEAVERVGTWQTVSLHPHETTKSLAMLLSYGLLFVVVAARIQQRADVERFLRWIAISVALMATFGLVQYFTSDGRFFWFYDHPSRSATERITGAFANPNHFAHFLVLGVGPLASWLLGAVRRRSGERPSRTGHATRFFAWQPLLLGAALIVVLLAILLSLSRGGTLALVAALATIAAIYAHGKLVDSKYLWSAVALAAVVVGLLSLYGYEQVSRRLSSLAGGSLETIDRDEGRRKIWRANISASYAGGLLGAGAGSHSAIYPVYLEASLPFEYTHAESGYLQVATENGWLGAALLLAGLSLCGAWSVSCVLHARSDQERLCFGAAAAGLSASVTHSVVDFVWYIPACMSVTIVLAACVMRLSQLASAGESAPAGRGLPRGRWLELAAASALLGGWAVHAYAGPGIAAVYWDRYLRLSAANRTATEQQWTALAASRPQPSSATKETLNEAMLRQLEAAVRWDPKFARAHLRLAAHSMAQFELRQLNRENRMSFSQIRDAAIASRFSTPADLSAWLHAAFGSDVELLRRSQAEARAAITLCPLQGEGYVYLGELCFLDGHGQAVVDAYLQQGLRVRPHDADVLFEVGRQKLLEANVAEALAHWRQCFDDTGPHQLKIVYLLAGQISAMDFLRALEPDWRTLKTIWSRYRRSASPEELQALLDYAADATQREIQQPRGVPAASIWFMQSAMYADVGRSAEALACLERAYACNPSQYIIRYELARALEGAGRYAEAEPHFRWCLARRPADKSLREALVAISKQRFSEREFK